MCEIISDRTITAEECEKILKDIGKVDIDVIVSGNLITLDVLDTDIKIQFVSVRDKPSIAVGELDSFTTATDFFIHYNDEILEVETDGPFEIGIAGLNLEVLEE